MKTVQLGHTGEHVSHLALGCMLMGTATDEATSVEMLDRYLDAGGTFLDTADCYAWWLRQGSHGGESEELLGRWFTRTRRRDDVFLATKGSAIVRDAASLWNDKGEMVGDPTTRYVGAGGDTLRRSIDDSLRRLRTDHVDLYYIHVDDRSTPLEETLEALAGIVAAGKARHIGWSNVRTWRLERIRQLCVRHGWPAPVAVQQQHSYLRRRPGADIAAIVDDEQLDYLRANDDLTLVAYSPILKGIYDDPAKRDGHQIMAAYEGADSEARLAVLTQVAAELSVTPNQLVIAWLLHQQEPAMIPLIGPRTLEQFEGAMPALDIQLTADHLARLEAAGA
jgi:aryl-alcohol dehydrogenase-like predicted oxidoreductase